MVFHWVLIFLSSVHEHVKFAEGLSHQKQSLPPFSLYDRPIEEAAVRDVDETARERTWDLR